MDNKQIIENGYRCFANGDVSGLLASFDENIEWTEAEGFPYGGTYTGANAIVENVFIKLGTEWEGETIVALGHYSGKFNKTGKSMKVPFAHVWTLRGGKIVKFVQYTDTLKVSEVL